MIEISSRGDGLEFALSNPVFYFGGHLFYKGIRRNLNASQQAERNKQHKGIFYKNKIYVDVEEAYKVNKFDNDDKDYGLMVELLTIKFSTYPDLIKRIDKAGGMEYLEKCNHTPMKGKSRWDCGNKGLFMSALKETYLYVKDKEVSSSDLEVLQNWLVGLDISYSLEKLGNLKVLDLGFKSLCNLPKEISKLKNLERLSLWDNNLTNLPIEISELTNLKALDLGTNKLTSLPKEIYDLTDLLYLDLNNNKLNSLSKEISKLSRLEYLDIRNNPSLDKVDLFKELPNCVVYQD